MRYKLLATAALALCAATAEAQTVGAALTAHKVNQRNFRNGIGAGLWLTQPLGQSRWSIGAAGSYSKGIAGKRTDPGLCGFRPHNAGYVASRLYSLSLIMPKQLLQQKHFGIALGPSAGYSSAASADAAGNAGLAFVGLWANAHCNLTNKLQLHLVLHPRMSPGGRDGSNESPDPFRGRNLHVTEGWLGLGYNLGKN